MADTTFAFIPRAARSADHSQIVQLEALRLGLWGTKSTWGRIHNLTG